MTNAAYTTKPILGIDRRTGEFVALVPSQSTPGLLHITTATTCSCRGFSYRQWCNHVSPAPSTRDGSAAHLQVLRAAGQWPPAISSASMARTYREIFGTGE